MGVKASMSSKRANWAGILVSVSRILGVGYSDTRWIPGDTRASRILLDSGPDEGLHGGLLSRIESEYGHMNPLLPYV